MPLPHDIAVPPKALQKQLCWWKILLA